MRLDKEQQKMVAKISFEILRIDVALFIAGPLVKGDINPLLAVGGVITFVTSFIVCIFFSKEK